MVHIILPFYLKFAKMKPPVQSQGQKIGWRCFDRRRRLRPNKTQHFLTGKIWRKFGILVDFFNGMLHGTCRHILFEKKPQPKNWRRYFSARFSWSLPAGERLAQHTRGEIKERINSSNCLARDSSGKREIGQDRFDQTEMFCRQKKKKNIKTRISNLKHFRTAHAEIESGNSRLDFKFNSGQHLLFRK